MTGAELKEIRILSSKKQKDFYAHLGFKGAYGSLLEKHYTDQQIPMKVRDKVLKKCRKYLPMEVVK